MLFPKNHLIKAMVFDFDGTLAVLTIDFGLMRRRVLEWMKTYGIGEERIHEKYLLEIIEEVRHLLVEERRVKEAEKFFDGAHQILKEVELEAAAGGKLIPGSKRGIVLSQGEGDEGRDRYAELRRCGPESFPGRGCLLRCFRLTGWSQEGEAPSRSSDLCHEGSPGIRS